MSRTLPEPTTDRLQSVVRVAQALQVLVNAKLAKDAQQEVPESCSATPHRSHRATQE